jgi:hypothetical protein
MSHPTREMMDHPLIQKLIIEGMLRPIEPAILMGLLFPPPAVYPKDRPFKVCECRHFVNYCSHIWQTDPRNIKFELRLTKGNSAKGLWA